MVFFFSYQKRVTGEPSQRYIDFRKHGVECSPKTRCGKGSRAGKKKKNYVFNQVMGQNVLKVIIKEKMLFRRNYLVLMLLEFFSYVFFC